LDKTQNIVLLTTIYCVVGFGVAGTYKK
jgi:hypothetical protein